MTKPMNDHRGIIGLFGSVSGTVGTTWLAQANEVLSFLTGVGTLIIILFTIRHYLKKEYKK